MKFTRYFLLIGITFMMLSSCVKDDLSDCPPTDIIDASDWYLHFRTLPSKYVFENTLESIDLYIYDTEAHDMVDVIDFSYDELAANDFSIHLGGLNQIIKDSYRFVAIMNATEHYAVNGHQTLEEYELSIVTGAGDSIATKLDDIFSGYHDADPLTRSSIRRDTMDLLKLTNDVYITIEFLNYSIPQENTLSSNINGTNGHYNFMMECLEKSLITYLPHTENYTDRDDYFEFQISTAKLTIDDDLMLFIEEWKQQVDIIRDVRLSLTGELAKIQDDAGYYLYDTDEKLMMEDEFYFYFLLDDDFTILELKVNGWYLVRNIVDL